MLICIADLHISHKSDRVFEASRLLALTDHLSQYRGGGYTLNLLGDTFDTNTPSLEDIRAFYNIIESLRPIFKEIVIIPGNHDYKVFNYLPHQGFTYIGQPTIVGDIQYLPWTHLEDFTSRLQSTKRRGKLLLTHARCTITPHIIEETNIQLLSERYEKVVLGDIHMPYSPYPNVFYTSEPSQHHYKSYSKNTTGYIIVDKDLNISRVFTDLPYKCKLPKCSFEDVDKILPSLSEENRYKLVVEDHVTNLQKLKKYKQSNIKFEVIPQVILSSQTKQGEELRDMVSGKISIEQLLFHYIEENYNFSPLLSSKILRIIK